MDADALEMNRSGPPSTLSQAGAHHFISRLGICQTSTDISHLQQQPERNSTQKEHRLISWTAQVGFRAVSAGQSGTDAGL